MPENGWTRSLGESNLLEWISNDSTKTVESFVAVEFFWLPHWGQDPCKAEDLGVKVAELRFRMTLLSLLVFRWVMSRSNSPQTKQGGICSKNHCEIFAALIPSSVSSVELPTETPRIYPDAFRHAIAPRSRPTNIRGSIGLIQVRLAFFNVAGACSRNLI